MTSVLWRVFSLGERQLNRFTARVAPWETLSGAPASGETRIFTRRSARTKSGSDWSIYSREFTRVHLAVQWGIPSVQWGISFSTVGDNISTVEVIQYSGDTDLKYYEFSKNLEIFSRAYFATKSDQPHCRPQVLTTADMVKDLGYKNLVLGKILL